MLLEWDISMVDGSDYIYLYSRDGLWQIHGSISNKFFTLSHKVPETCEFYKELSGFDFRWQIIHVGETALQCSSRAKLLTQLYLWNSKVRE